MYNPAAFRETRRELLIDAMARYPFATLITFGSNGLEASHIPFLYRPDETGLGVLHGHIARDNPQWRSYRPDVEALAIFSGPQHYVSPNWYPSKQEHGMAVPTWNYVAVHARGRLTFPDNADWLRSVVTNLTAQHESMNNTPWRVSDAPPEYITAMLKAIVGVELAISSLEGKWKVSQNRPIPDRRGVVAALRTIASDDAENIADLVERTLPDQAEGQ